MKPINYEHANAVLKAPDNAPEVIDLPITRLKYLDGTIGVESCWELSDEELDKIKKTKRVYFVCLGSTHPPILLKCKSELD